MPDLSKTLEAVGSLLRIQSTATKSRQRLEERLAKAESNYSMSITKIEKLEDSLREKEKEIGRLENTMLRERAILKEGHSKKKTEDIVKEKGKAVKQMADKQFEHEIKKKDLEIAKLKDTLKKSAMMAKDRIETDVKWSKYEINNFYNGLENDFNMLDSKKTEVYRGHLEESTLLREIAMQFYSDLKSTILDMFPRVEINSHLAWSILNKPMILVKDSVLKCHRELIQVLRTNRLGSGGGENIEHKEMARYTDVHFEEESLPQTKWQKHDHSSVPKGPHLLQPSDKNRWAIPEKKRHFYTKSELNSDFLVSGVDSPSPPNDSRLRSSSDINIVHL